MSLPPTTPGEITTRTKHIIYGSSLYKNFMHSLRRYRPRAGEDIPVSELIPCKPLPKGFSVYGENKERFRKTRRSGKHVSRRTFQSMTRRTLVIPPVESENAKPAVQKPIKYMLSNRLDVFHSSIFARRLEGKSTRRGKRVPIGKPGSGVVLETPVYEIEETEISLPFDEIRLGVWWVGYPEDVAIQYQRLKGVNGTFSMRDIVTCAKNLVERVKEAAWSEDGPKMGNDPFWRLSKKGRVVIGPLRIGHLRHAGGNAFQVMIGV